jgi:hypothetical protein
VGALGLPTHLGPDEGLVRYGVYTFPKYTFTTEIKCIPEWDSARRTVIYSNILISLRTHLTGRDIGDATRALVQVLNRPALPFVYTGHGYNFGVNVSGVKDVRWGPKPSARIETLGPNAAILHFTVEAALPDAPGARFSGALLEFGYTVGYDRDPAGYTTRRVIGYLRIPMTRNGPNDRRLPDNIDSYLEDVYPAMIPEFRRTPGTWELNAAKDGAEFTVVDEQMPPNKPPPGCVFATARHDLQTTPGRMLEWNGVISGEYEIARNGVATIANARDAFFAVCKDRINHTIDTLSRSELVAQTAGGVRLFAVPVSFGMSEPDIYGRTRANYSLSYKVTGASLRAMLQASGMHRPTPGNDWRRWVQSLGPVLGARGHAGLTFSIEDDRIVDLFQPAPPVIQLGTRPPRAGQNFGDIPRDVFPEPTPDGSWIYFRNGCFLEVDGGVSEVRTLPTEPRTAQGDVYGTTAGRSAAAVATATAIGAITGAFPSDVAANADFYFPPARTAAQKKHGGGSQRQAPQRRAIQGGVLFVRGEALRARYGIPCPAIERWGDATLTPANRRDRGEGFWTDVVGNAIWPITYAKWNLRFILDTIPAGQPPALPNPLQGGGGASEAGQTGRGDPLRDAERGAAGVAGALGAAAAAAVGSLFGG